MKPRKIKYDLPLSFPTRSGIQDFRSIYNTLWIPAFAGMTRVTVIVLIFLGIALSSFVYAQNPAQQPCRSGQGGYCVKIVAPKDYRNSAQRNINSGFAGLTIVDEGIPGLEFLGKSANLGDLLANIYYFLLGIVGLSALVMFVWGGIEYMLAGDKDPTKAKERMKNAVYGLVLAFTSYLILYTINPDLVSRLDVNLDQITPQQRTEPPPGQTQQPPQQPTGAPQGDAIPQ